jgi:phosphoribosylanthranilate isomerase
MKTKVCCILDVAEARLAAENGADRLGLVGPMPSVLSLEQALLSAFMEEVRTASA